MVYSCTMNPAVDLFIRVEKLIPGIVNRTLEHEVIPNGKAVNISFLLKLLNIDSVALGFSAGFTGRFIEDELEKKGIPARFIQVGGVTRINVFTMVDSENSEYQLINQGPSVSKENIAGLLDMISRLSAEDILCVSGSNPPGVPDDIYIKIAKLSLQKRFRLIVDSSCITVKDTMFAKPYLLKPTLEELAAWFNRKTITKNDAVILAKELAAKGAEHILVSMGKDGAYYINKDLVLYANAPSGKVVNTACAGDTMIASFLSGLLTGKKIEDCLCFSVAAASSTAFRPGLTDYSDVEYLMRDVNVTTM